jgi:hypothetical protein
MDLKLHIINQGIDEYSMKHRLCFAVIDQSKSKSYPINYVCILPTRIKKGKAESAFEKLFKEKSVEQAKKLLTDALKKVDDSEVRSEIERRLKLLEPKKVSEIKCSGCGKLFLPIRPKKFKKYFCEKCVKKKFGSRQ